MRFRFSIVRSIPVILAGAQVWLQACAQDPRGAAEVTSAVQGVPQAEAAKADYVVPRTPDGHPDLRGTWTTSDFALVPVSSYKFVPSDNRTGDVPSWWYEGWDAKRERPYMVFDPPDGRIPLTSEAAKSARRDEWEDDTRLDDIQSPKELDQWGRCISRGPFLLLPSSYNSGYQIVQTPDAVAILAEMIHETRIIHLTGQHPPKDVRLWLGDSRGRWEGDTLVVDMTNFAQPAGKLLPGVFKIGSAYTGPGETLHLTERFRRVSDDSIEYQVRIEDPAVYEKPWSLALTLRNDPSYDIYEYACHEGNHFIANVLTGARTREKARALRK